MRERPRSSPTIISATMLQRQIGSIIRRAAKNREHFVVERDGFPVVAVISLVDYEMLMRDHERQKSATNVSNTKTK